jgi:transcriptional regulator with XRE-family HTH domain
MKERIKQFMDYKALNAADLADTIGVQRSNVSHVVNGRNNPSSSFIEKLLLTFPELNARWLITGEGDMVSQSDEPVKVEKVETKRNPDLFTAHVEAKDLTRSKPSETSDGKNIERIVILYDDSTFKDYRP